MDLGDVLSTLIYTTIKISDYPQLKFLPEGASMRIQGKIDLVDGYGIHLVNPKLFFDNN